MKKIFFTFALLILAVPFSTMAEQYYACQLEEKTEMSQWFWEDVVDRDGIRQAECKSLASDWSSKHGICPTTKPVLCRIEQYTGTVTRMGTAGRYPVKHSVWKKLKGNEGLLQVHSVAACLETAFTKIDDENLKLRSDNTVKSCSRCPTSSTASFRPESLSLAIYSGDDAENTKALLVTIEREDS